MTEDLLGRERKIELETGQAVISAEPVTIKRLITIQVYALL